MTLREEIKEKAAYQRILKNHRKTVNFKPDKRKRIVNAAMKHLTNRLDLRHMYAAYAELRGMKIPLPKDGIYWETEVERLVRKHKREYKIYNSKNKLWHTNRTKEIY